MINLLLFFISLFSGSDSEVNTKKDVDLHDNVKVEQSKPDSFYHS